MPRRPALVQSAPPPPPPVAVPRPTVRPTRDALIIEGLRMMRTFGPPASDHDNHRTAALLADRIDACWDFWQQAG